MKVAVNEYHPSLRQIGLVVSHEGRNVSAMFDLDRIEQARARGGMGPLSWKDVAEIAAQEVILCVRALLGETP